MPNRPSVLVFSRKGYIKRMPADLFATQVCALLSSTSRPSSYSRSPLCNTLQPVTVHCK